MKKTIILGASPNPTRYAYLAAERLLNHGHDIVPVGIKKGEVFGKTIVNSKDIQKDIDTITMYIGSIHQPEWYNYILEHTPKRIIFNPGTENPELYQLAKEKNIEIIEGCTLVMLSVGTF